MEEREREGELKGAIIQSREAIISNISPEWGDYSGGQWAINRGTAIVRENTVCWYTNIFLFKEKSCIYNY